MSQPIVTDFQASKLVLEAVGFAKAWESVGFLPDVKTVINSEFKALNDSLNALPSTILKDPSVRFFQPDPTDALRHAILHNDGFVVITFMSLPKGYVFKFHDHPSMTVLTKVLSGKMTIEYLQIEEQSKFYESRPKVNATTVARRTDEIRLSAGQSTALFPELNNIHSLRAEEDTVIVDLLVNYYDDVRVCSYFEVTRELSDRRLELRISSQE